MILVVELLGIFLGITVAVFLMELLGTYKTRRHNTPVFKEAFKEYKRHWLESHLFLLCLYLLVSGTIDFFTWVLS